MLESHVKRRSGKTEEIRKRQTNIEPIQKARLIAEAALDKKGEDIVIMDMRAVSNLTDYFVISSAPSMKRIQAISEGIEEELFKKGVKHGHVEGKKEALWVLIDYGDVIAHVFYGETRDFYNIERLWHDAPKERLSPQCTSTKSKKT